MALREAVINAVCHRDYLELIRKTPDITAARLAELTGLTPKGIEWQIAQLKKNGLLERVGPDKGGHWKVKKM